MLQWLCSTKHVLPSTTWTLGPWVPIHVGMKACQLFLSVYVVLCRLGSCNGLTPLKALLLKYLQIRRPWATIAHSVIQKEYHGICWTMIWIKKWYVNYNLTNFTTCMMQNLVWEHYYFCIICRYEIIVKCTWQRQSSKGKVSIPMASILWSCSS